MLQLIPDSRAGEMPVCVTKNEPVCVTEEAKLWKRQWKRPRNFDPHWY